MLMKLFIYLAISHAPKCLQECECYCPSVNNLICGVPDTFHIATVVSGSVSLLKVGHSDMQEADLN